MMFRPRFATALAIATLSVLALADAAFPQDSPSSPPTSINNDANLPFPVPQGRPGMNDQSAILEIEACEKASSLPANRGLVISGRIFTGIEPASSGSEVSLTMEGEGQLRMDIRDSEGRERGMRLIGRTPRIIGAPPSDRQPSISEFGDPLMFPISLKSITSGTNVAVVDDGFLVVGGKRLHEITVTHFPISGRSHLPKPAYQLSQAVSLYFDPDTHLLSKSIMVNHSLTDVALQYLQITSYEEYKQVDKIMEPSRYVETVDGQQVMVLKTDDVGLTASRDAAYFK